MLARVKTNLHLHQYQKDLKQAYDKIEQLVRTDPLTELPNRRGINKFVEKEFERAKRYGEIFTVMMMDLDHFKKVNDTLGHIEGGDDCLILVTKTLKQSLRAVDHIGRFGGEEFIAVLPSTGLDEAILLGERLRQATEHLYPKFNRGYAS